MRDLETSIEAESVTKQLRAIEDFYDVLLDGCYNKVLKATLQELHGKISRLRATSILSPGRIQNTLKEMSRISEAIRANNEQEAFDAAVEHMQQTSAVALRVISYLNERTAEGIAD